MSKAKKSPEPKPDFVVFSAPLAVKEHDGDDRPMLVATASSTAIDLEADRFTKSALEQMRDGFKGRVIFMNHSYRVPLDVFGVVEETSLVKREGRLDLDMVIRVETGNPLAVQTYDYVVNGTRLGVSVGVIVTESEKSDDEDEYGTRIVDITGVIPLEASIVGIPANQTAWTQAAIKSLYERGAIEFDDAEVAARPWLNADDPDEKESDMAKKHTDEDEQPKEDAPADDSDEKKDQEGEDEEGGGDDTHDENDGDGPHKQDDATPDNDEEPEPETKDDPDETPDDLDPNRDPDDPDESPESAPVESPDGDPDDTKDDSETKNDFDDDVAADEAAYALIDKMYTGFYVALDNLIPIILDTDMNSDARRKAGDEVIESWSKYISDTWEEVIEMLDESKAVDMDEDFSLASRLHDLVAEDEAVECEATQVQEIVDQASAISDLATKHAEENERLREELERKTKGLELAMQIIDAVMELPIPTVTTEAAQVARSLAEKFPNLDNKVVELLARHAPPAPGQ